LVGQRAGELAVLSNPLQRSEAGARAALHSQQMTVVGQDRPVPVDERTSAFAPTVSIESVVLHDEKCQRTKSLRDSPLRRVLEPIGW
jgi:hypothetical protein